MMSVNRVMRKRLMKRFVVRRIMMFAIRTQQMNSNASSARKSASSEMATTLASFAIQTKLRNMKNTKTSNAGSAEPKMKGKWLFANKKENQTEMMNSAEMESQHFVWTIKKGLIRLKVIKPWFIDMYVRNAKRIWRKTLDAKIKSM